MISAIFFDRKPGIRKPSNIWRTSKMYFMAIKWKFDSSVHDDLKRLVVTCPPNCRESNVIDSARDMLCPHQLLFLRPAKPGLVYTNYSSIGNLKIVSIERHFLDVNPNCIYLNF